MPRQHITGFFVRVKTEKGDWENLDVATLTDIELVRFVDSFEDLSRAKGWVTALCQWIRDNSHETEAKLAECERELMTLRRFTSDKS